MKDNNRGSIYIYVESNMYINIERSLIQVYTRLFKNSKPFESFNREIRKSLSWLPLSFIRAFRVFIFTYRFSRKRKRYKKNKYFSFLHGPYHGECILPLRECGYKVFNLKEKWVKTVFDECIPLSKVHNSINTSLDASRCVFAPKIIKYSKEDRYLIEELINLNRASYNLNNPAKIFKEVYPILVSIITAKEYKTIDFSEYTKLLEGSLDACFRTWYELKGVNSEDIQKIERFCIQIFMMCNASSSPYKKIALVNSHGDFWEGNVLVDNNKYRTIDWNTLGIRSCYFDFFTMMFMTCRKSRDFQHVNREGLMDLSRVINHFFGEFYKKIGEVNYFNFKIYRDLIDLNIYRYLFYIETLILKMEPDNGNVECIDELIIWVDRFRIYEEYNDGQRNIEVQ